MGEVAMSATNFGAETICATCMILLGSTYTKARTIYLVGGTADIALG